MNIRVPIIAGLVLVFVAAVGFLTGMGCDELNTAQVQTQPDTQTAAPTGATCSDKAPLSGGDHTYTLQHDGRNRSYIVHIPRGYLAEKAVPLVLDFHGHMSSAAQEKSGSGWLEKADAKGFIVVFPSGIGGSWNVGNCCGQALSQNSDDVGFAKAIVDKLKTIACIDPKRVYATGISNGGGFAHRLACEAADVFAAIAAASADLVTEPCTPVRPISEMSIRGTGDRLVAYEGGLVGSGWHSPGAVGGFELWQDVDNCTGSPDTIHQYCQRFTQCEDDVEVMLCTLPRVGHILYDNALGFDVPDVAWEMFERQTMP